MNLSTTYLGLRLANPVMPGASPLADDLGTVRRLEDAGAAAIVMRSLFEEQIAREQMAALHHHESHEGTHPEALTYLPQTDVFMLGPDEYLEQLHRIKKAVSVPVIASLNGSTLGGWLGFSRLIQQTGADALELNVYYLPTDPTKSAADVERNVVEMVAAVRAQIDIPLAVKLGPRYTALAHFAVQLSETGADGLVLFNRFYQADIDIEELENERKLRLSTRAELLLRLRWLAVLFGKTGAALACSGGVHETVDVIKAVMAGADAVQVVSALLKQGPGYLETLIKGLSEWLEEHEYESVEQMRGSMSLERCPDPKAYERANYIEILQSWEDRTHPSGLEAPRES